VTCWTFDWIDAEECEPCNDELCLVQLQDGTYALAKQDFGEWCDAFYRGELGEIEKWAEISPEKIFEILTAALTKPSEYPVLAPRSLLERIIERLEDYTDEGPIGKGWKSDRLENDLRIARDLLGRKDD